MTRYLITYLHISEATVVVAYSFISITAPTGGVVIGGIVCNKLGGYEDPRIKKWIFYDSMIVN